MKSSWSTGGIVMCMCVSYGCVPEIDVGPPISLEDIDGDGWTVAEGDCWEGSIQPRVQAGARAHEVISSDVYPGAPDQWYDGVDQNCDGLDDFDQDGDGFVLEQYVGIETLNVEGTGTLPGGDCDDRNPQVHPEAIEVVADGVDSNCNEVDLCFVDRDLDGSGINVETTGPIGCVADGVSPNASDCDDNNPYVFPDNVEACDGIDNNCDGSKMIAELDQDGDGYVPCIIDEHGWLGDSEIVGDNDCNDDNPMYYPSQQWYLDADGDGYGSYNSPSEQRQSCAPTGYFSSLVDTDCDAGNPNIHPFALEETDSVDSNCDGMEDAGYYCAGAPNGVDGYYVMCSNHLTASESGSICQQFGYDGLASIIDLSENQRLHSLNDFAVDGVWLGGEDSGVENQFEWSDGSIWSYTNWYGNHPYVNGSSHNCLKMLSSGKWAESSCGALFTGFACGKR